MPHIRSQQNFSTNTRFRLLFLVILCGLFWVVILGQLWHLQVGQYDMYADLSLNNRIRLKRIKAPRGLFTDRNNEVLVSNRPAFNAAVILEDAGDKIDETLNKLSCLLNVPVEDFKEKVASGKKKLPPFEPILLYRHITFEQVAILEEHELELPGMTILTEPVRGYFYNTLASHALGYLGEVTENQLKQPNYAKVKPGDLVGQYGLERVFDTFLTGEDGGKQVEVNAQGREFQVLGQRQPDPGSNLVLNIDLKLQKVAEEALAGKSGAVVALDPNNGEVLAMVSTPNFDPNLLAAGVSRKQWQEIVNDPAKSLQDRAIQCQYPSGSVFKIIMTSAGLERGVIGTDTAFSCSGHLRSGRWTYDCWKKEGHGRMTILPALTQSCNVFYYNVGRGLGVEAISEFASKFGLGRPSGIDLLNEKKGIVPSPKWKKKTFNQPWYPGETFSLSIGQGYLNVTPLQLANLASMVANKGTLYKPQLVKKIVRGDGTVEREFKPEMLATIQLKPQTWDILREGLRNVVQNPRGTGGSAKITGVTIAGKTGTAQCVAKKKTGEKIPEDQIPEEFRDHAWFVAFAPADEDKKPLIALAILVEHGGHGGSACAPIAKDMIRQYFNDYYPELVAEAAIEDAAKAEKLAKQEAEKLAKEAAMKNKQNAAQKPKRL